MGETTHRNQGASGEAILHSGYVFMANWGCYQHPRNPLPSPLDAWEDIRDHHSCATGTASSGHPGELAVPPKRKGAKRPCHAQWGTLHGPASSWCSFIFPNGADGDCRGEERELFRSAVSQRSLKPFAIVDKWGKQTLTWSSSAEHWWYSRTWLHWGYYFKILHSDL